MFKGRHFDRSVILLCVRWYLAYGLSLRDLNEMMAERGISVDHSTIHRWVVHFSPLLLKHFNRRKRAVGGNGIPEDIVNGVTWELFDLTKDWTENNNVAATFPDKLKELQDLFWVEAAKYQVLPLDASGLERFVAPRPSVVAGRSEFSYSGPIVGIPQGTAPSILNKSFTITAEIDVTADGGDGMLVTAGGRFGGWALYLSKGKPVFVYNMFDLARPRVEGPQPLSPGKHTIVFDFKYDGPGFGKGGTGVMKVDGADVANQPFANTIPFALESSETFDVGSDTGTGVNDADYIAPFPFTGTIDALKIRLN